MRRLIKFPSEIWTNGGGLPECVRTIDDAIMLISVLPSGVAARPHWRAAKELLQLAADSGHPRHVAEAAAQLRNALKQEHWLAE
jgi:hypothetical protein